MAELHAVREETRAGFERRVRFAAAAETPQQVFRFEPGAATIGAGIVAAVLGQQHADVHLVALAFEPGEETLRAVPHTVVPIALAFDDPASLRFVQLAPGHVDGDAGAAGEAHQVVLHFAVALRLPGFDRPLGQALVLVRDDQAIVDPDDPAESAAGFAGADRGVEGKVIRCRLGVVDIAGRAVKPGGKALRRTRFTLRIQDIDRQPPPPSCKRRFQRFQQTSAIGFAQPQAVLHDFDARALATVDTRITLLLQIAFDLGGGKVLRHLDAKADHDQRLVMPCPLQKLCDDGFGGVAADFAATATAVQASGPRVQQLEMVVEFGHRADRGTRGSHRVGLIDGDGWRDALHTVDGRFVHTVQELPCVRRESLHIAALTFGIDRIESERGFAGAGHAGDHDQLAQRQFQIEVLEVVLASAVNANAAVVHRRGIGLI